MSKSIIIIISVLWLFCNGYMILARSMDYPGRDYAMVGSWVASFLLLACVIIYIRKHKNNKRS